jgi:NAD(P)-dependent dehydrogenase (short-subunit alcohol dehydrogenase family)
MYVQKYDLKGRGAVVTGGGRPIGLACAEALAEAGAKVIIADQDAKIAVERQAEGRAEMKAKGFDVDVVKMDVTKSVEVTAIADDLARNHQGVDILINNAGIARSDTPVETVADEHWLNVIDVNLNGAFWCCRASGRHMLAKGSGSIVNVGSISRFIVSKPQPQSYYNASKAAVHHLTKSLAAEWASRGVRVNAVASTYIDTPLNRFGIENPEMYKHWIGGTPMGRMGRIDEIGSVALANTLARQTLPAKHATALWMSKTYQRARHTVVAHARKCRYRQPTTSRNKPGPDTDLGRKSWEATSFGRDDYGT